MRRPQSPRLLATLLALAFTLPVAAGEPVKRVITPEDLWAIKRPETPDLSPDGSRLVFGVKECNLEKNNSVTHLWLLDTTSGAARALTAAESTDTTAVWSPDGKRIAFASKRGSDEQPSLYVIQADGGEAEKIVELPLAISHPRWLADGRHLVFASNVLPALAADQEAMKKELKRQKEKEAKMTAKVTENAFYRYFDTWLTDGQATHLYSIDLDSKQTTDLTPHWARRFRFDQEIQFDLSPDGKWIALCAGTTPPPYYDRENTDIYLLSIEHPETPWKNLTSDNRESDDSPRFMPDGRSVLFGRKTKAVGTELTKLMRVEVTSGTITRLLPGADLSPQDWHASPDGRTLFFCAEDHGRTKIFSAPADGATFRPLVSDGTNSGLCVGSHALFFLKHSFTRSDEVQSLDLTRGTAEVRTHLNDALFAQLKLGKVEEVTTPGADGDPILTWVIYPPDFDPAKKYPLLQLMHGGPATMVGDMWQLRWNAQVFVTPGYVAAWVDRHGSTGFGEKFLASIDGGWGEKPYEDIMKATDYLLDKFPFLDRQRTAALGASYGGYMACWICGHTDRFKAIVCHDGATDFTTQFASDVGLYWQADKMGGSPWNRTAAYEKENPMTYASHFKTPTLIIHGGIDYRVPIDESLEFYTALQAQHIPSRLLYFPDENHWVLHPQNSVFWYDEVRDWVARWLK